MRGAVLFLGVVIVAATAVCTGSSPHASSASTTTITPLHTSIILLTPTGNLDAATLNRARAVVQERMATVRSSGVDVSLVGKTIEVRVQGSSTGQVAQIVADLRLRGELGFAPVLALGGSAAARLGPVGFRGTDLVHASSEDQGGEWSVNVTVKPRARAVADALMNACYHGDATCPALPGASGAGTNGLMAIVLDGRIISDPAVNDLNLASDPGGFEIVGQFSAARVKALATTLNTQPLPAVSTVTVHS